MINEAQVRTYLVNSRTTAGHTTLPSATHSLFTTGTRKRLSSEMEMEMENNAVIMISFVLTGIKPDFSALFVSYHGNGKVFMHGHSPKDKRQRSRC